MPIKKQLMPNTATATYNLHVISSISPHSGVGVGLSDKLCYVHLKTKELNHFLKLFGGNLGGGGKTKEILMKIIGVKVLITNRITWNSKQTKNKQ